MAPMILLSNKSRDVLHDCLPLEWPASTEIDIHPPQQQVRCYAQSELQAQSDDQLSCTSSSSSLFDVETLQVLEQLEVCPFSSTQPSLSSSDGLVFAVEKLLQAEPAGNQTSSSTGSPSSLDLDSLQALPEDYNFSSAAELVSNFFIIDEQSTANTSIMSAPNEPSPVRKSSRKSSSKREPLIKRRAGNGANFWLTCVWPGCGKSFNDRSNLKKHVQTVHKVERRFVCAECNTGFTRKDHLKQHMSIHTSQKNHVCPQCSKSFARDDNLKQHMARHRDEKNFVCPKCSKGFPLKQDLKQHMVSHSAVEKRFVCPTCSKGFKINQQLEQHMVSHEVDRKFFCTNCGKKFLREASLKKHMASHGDSRKFTCPYCPKTFKRSDTLYNHKKIHTGKKK